MCLLSRSSVNSSPEGFCFLLELDEFLLHRQHWKWDCTEEAAGAVDIKGIIKSHNYAETGSCCGCSLMFTVITAAATEL